MDLSVHLSVPENRPTRLAESSRETQVHRDQKLLAVQAQCGRALKTGCMSDFAPTGEPGALAQLTANWRSVADNAFTASEQADREPGHRSRLLAHHHHDENRASVARVERYSPTKLPAEVLRPDSLLKLQTRPSGASVPASEKNTKSCGRCVAGGDQREVSKKHSLNEDHSHGQAEACFSSHHRAGRSRLLRGGVSGTACLLHARKDV